MPLSVETGAGFLSNTMSPGPRPTSVPTVPSGMLIHPTFWPQYINVTDRQDIGPVACGEPLLVTVAQKLQVSVVADETARRAIHHGKLNVLQTKVDAQYDKFATELS